MKIETTRLKRMSLLEIAIIIGIIALFAAIAIPLIRGALIRQRTVECARKILWAAEAFDFYAQTHGDYPSSQKSVGEVSPELAGVFALFQIDWWEEKTDLGGRWKWYNNGKMSSVVISGARMSHRKMLEMDALLDDGNLDTGIFQCHVSQYHYIIRETVL